MNVLLRLKSDGSALSRAFARRAAYARIRELDQLLRSQTRGVSLSEMADTMQWPESKIEEWLGVLIDQGRVEKISRRNGMVLYEARNGGPL